MPPTDATPDALSFRTIDLERQADLCVAFRRDSYVCSFGTDEAFFSTGGVDGYLEWLKEGIVRHPAGHVHVWQGDRIIGQLEMQIGTWAPPSGYVSLFYLVPEQRGQNLGGALQRYAEEFMRAGGARRARLSVSPSNARALAYYRKHGWRDLGPREGDSSVHLMELDLGE
jgi:ribosomal protein S18 acetylase RimI-like enzyme